MLVDLVANRYKMTIYLFINLIISTYFLSTILYYNYYGTLVTYNAVFQLGQVGEVKDSVFELFNPLYLILYLDIAFVSLLVLIKRYPFKRHISVKKKLVYSILIVFLLISITNIYIPVKDGVINEMKLGQTMGFFNYQAYTAFANHNNNVSSANITYDKIREVKGLDPKENLKYYGVAKDKNVLVIQLEAFQDFLMHLKIDGKEVTPHLSEFANKNMYFTQFYQQIGKGNTSDAEFMLNTSIYPTSIDAMSQKYGDRKIPSFPSILKDYGYTSATFHTNDISFWNRNEMYEALGFDKYYAKPFFDDKDKIAFGSSDEVLYDKSIDELIKIVENDDKFYANLIAMSSHHPFKIPESKGLFNLPDRYEDSTFGRYIQAANYADKAFGQLISKLKENGLWKDTLIVVYGDHFGMKLPQITDAQDITLIKEVLGEDYSRYLDTFNIPLIIRVPESDINESIDTVGGQVDLMPIISNLLGVSLENKIYFGQDILNYPDNTLGMRFYLPTGSFLSSNYFFIPGSTFEEGNLRNIKTREKVELNSDHKKYYDRVLELMDLSDAYADSLPKR
ncbi:LTA synthase family protein [Clostridium sp. D2Q-11]|uniref:LTA synthase family protein n=1 Tax=Anaeromonas frigoriresistens TaxID=2683708 RepID=A0A942V0B2_9FIRM|nr:LTA synthase family protein [Anaeromonas frigoriresistens]MBS4538842.1 LTA synthase family protein [Anaeromonas frigoriresistens]